MPPKYSLYPADFEPQLKTTDLPQLNFQTQNRGITPEGLSKTLGIVSGIGDIAQMGIGLAQIKDVSPYDYQLKSYEDIGRQGASSNSQLADMYGEVQRGVNIPSSDELRGMDSGQKFGSVLSAGLSGAVAGSSLGLPGIIGGTITGLAGGTVGAIAGDIRAQREADRLRREQQEAYKNNITRLGVEGDRLADRNFRSQYAHIGARGGEIQKPTVQDFADRVLGHTRKPVADRASLGFKKEYCSGGLKVSIRVK